ncbi:MAG: FtsB family cell division protein [Bacillota bacterium]
MQAQSNIIALPKRSTKSQLQPDARRKRARGNRLLIVFLVLFLCYVAITAGQQEIRLRHLRAELQAVSSQREQQMAEKERLEQELAEVKRDEYIERTARDKLGFLKPGDFIYLVGKTGPAR